MRRAVGFSPTLTTLGGFFELRLLYECGLCATWVQRKCGFWSSAAFIHDFTVSLFSILFSWSHSLGRDSRANFFFVFWILLWSWRFSWANKFHKLTILPLHKLLIREVLQYVITCQNTVRDLSPGATSSFGFATLRCALAWRETQIPRVRLSTFLQTKKSVRFPSPCAQIEKVRVTPNHKTTKVRKIGYVERP